MGEQMDKARLIEQIRAARQRLEEVVASFSPDQMTRPGLSGGWSVKDILAHVAAWEGRMVGWLETALQGETPQLLPPGMTWADLDLWNEQTYREHRNRALDDVQAGFAASYPRALQSVEAMPEDDLIDPDRFAWLEGHPLWRLVAANTFEHYAEHEEALRIWREELEWRSVGDGLEAIGAQMGQLAHLYQGSEQGEFLSSLQRSLHPFLDWNTWEHLWAAQGEKLPPLSEPTTAALALSFGLWADGAPGRTNEQLAAVLVKLMAGGLAAERIYAQWEIADVLRAREKPLPRSHVTWPPRFHAAEIRAPAQLVERLYGARNMPHRPAGYVYCRLTKKARRRLQQYRCGLQPLDEGRIAQDLNRLLRRADFCRDYLDAVHKRDRPALQHLDRGPAGYERRRLPQRSAARNMGPGQVMRVNRLILESVFADELQRGDYLGTRDVCVQMAAAPQAQDVVLVAHPDHVYRCFELLQDMAAVAGKEWRIWVADCRGVAYDPRSAQSWTADPASFWRCEIGARQREVMAWWDRPSTDKGCLTA